MPAAELVQVDGLSLGIPGHAPLVHELDLQIDRGGRWALLGESGAGKSLSALALVHLLPPPVQRLAGRVLVAGVDPAAAPPVLLGRLRGGVVGLAFQEPEAALNPVFSVGFQLRETLRAHHRTGRGEVERQARSLLESVGLAPATEMLRAYPHQLSGGQLQRATLALALAGGPSLLVADEPTSALDPVTRREILDLLEWLCRERELALLLVSHDLAAVEQLARRVLVMYAGEVVEETSVEQLLAEPLHPYTRLLVALTLDGGATAPAAAAARGLPGCQFAPRCPIARAACSTARPRLEPTGDGRRVRCPFVRPGGGAQPVSQAAAEAAE